MLKSVQVNIIHLKICLQCIVIVGSERFNNYKGYGDTFTFAGDHRYFKHQKLCAFHIPFFSFSIVILGTSSHEMNGGALGMQYCCDTSFAFVIRLRIFTRFLLPEQQ